MDDAGIAEKTSPAFLAGGGEMGALMRAHDWSTSPLGAPGTWPGSLRSAVQLMLGNRQLMFVAWGPELAFLYNDGYAPTFGAKHPWALGRPFREVWSEIWSDIEPLVEKALAGETTYNENLHLVMERNGYPEDAWFTFSYSPLRDEGGRIAGMFCAGIETTEEVLTARRTAFRLALDDRLRDLSDPGEVMAAASEVLGTHLGAARVGYAEVDAAGWAAIEREWNPAGLPSILGRHRLDDYGPARIADLRAGRTDVIADFAADARLGPSDVAAHHRLGIGAQVVMPLVKDGHLSALLFVHAPAPRRWNADEVAAVGDAAERTWAAVGRGRAEASLRESERELRFALKAGRFGTWTLDLVTGELTTSGTCRVNFGRDPDAPFTYADLRDAIHPDDRDRMAAAVERSVATGEDYDIEYRIVPPSGEVRWVAIRAQPSHAADGTPLSMTGVSIDVTERRRTDEAVRASEARARFRVELGDALRGLTTPEEITAAVAGRIGPYLGVDQANYYRIDGDDFVVTDEWRTTANLGILGRHRLADFGVDILRRMRAGEVLRLDDTRGTEGAGAFAAAGMAAVLSVPLRRDGRWVGGLHVHAARPRAWTDEDESLLREVASHAWAAVERAQAEADLREGEARWRALFEAMHEGFVICEIVRDPAGTAVDLRYLAANAAAERLSGLAPARIVGRLASEAIPGLERHWTEAYARVADTGEPAHAEYPVAPLGLWLEVFLYRTGPDQVAALFLDITERRAAAERQALLSREVDHRAKNALAVVQAALRLTRAPDVEGFRAAIEGRVAALARAQTMLAEDRWEGSGLRALLEGELRPFLGDEATPGSRAVLEGPEVVLPPGATQPLAMAVHELATNAMKYGALSVPSGRLVVSWSLAGAGDGPPLLRLRWAEAGGPPVAGPPGRRGFGTRVLDGTVRGQLGGTAALAWEATGLVCEITVPIRPGGDVTAAADDGPLPDR